MGIAAIIAIAVIVVLSVVSVFVAEEPLDEIFHLEAAMNGFPLQPLATKTANRNDVNPRVVDARGASLRDANPHATSPQGANRKDRSADSLVSSATFSSGIPVEGAR